MNSLAGWIRKAQGDDAVITTLDAGKAQLLQREFQVRVHLRDLAAGIQPQDKMQVLAVSFDPTSELGTLPIIVLTFWLRESRTVIVQYSLEEQVEWRVPWYTPNSVTFSDHEIRTIEKRLPELVTQALFKVGVSGTGGAVTVWCHQFGFGANGDEGPNDRAHQDWPIRRALGLEMRLDRGTGGTVAPS